MNILLIGQPGFIDILGQVYACFKIRENIKLLLTLKI